MRYCHVNHLSWHLVSAERLISYKKHCKDNLHSVSINTYIKFNDGYLIYYPKNEADDMLVNGIMQIETSQFSYTEIDGKDIWLNVLDDYGGRIKADGLDNFYDLMMDPITSEGFAFRQY